MFKTTIVVWTPYNPLEVRDEIPQLTLAELLYSLGHASTAGDAYCAAIGSTSVDAPLADSQPPSEAWHTFHTTSDEVEVPEACPQCRGTGMYDACCRPQKCPCGALERMERRNQERALEKWRLQKT